MFLRNTSKYPDEEVRRLVGFAAQGFDLRAVCVNVKHSSYAYAGRAYNRVPRGYSNAPKSAQHLVVLRIGKFTKVLTNARAVRRWVKVKPGEDIDPMLCRHCARWIKGVEQRWLEKPVLRETRYGGDKSPLIEYRSWEEMLVGLAAHEFAHIHQFKNKLPLRESFCERKSAEVLERFRACKEQEAA